MVEGNRDEPLTSDAAAERLAEREDDIRLVANHLVI